MANLTLLIVLSVSVSVAANNSVITPTVYEYLLPENLTQYEEECVDCVEQVLNRYDRKRSLFIYSYNGSTVDAIAELAMRLSTRISRTDLDLTRMKTTKISHFLLILIDQVADLVQYFRALQYTLGFNSIANYFVVYKGDEDLDLVFETLVEVYALRSIVLDKFNDFYKAEEFEKNCGKRSKAEFMFKCKDFDYWEILKVFHKKMSSWYGCPVRALALTMPPYVIDVNDEFSPGFEVKIFRTAAKKLNFTETYVEHNFTHWGFHYNNRNYTLMFQALFEKKGDVMFGMVHANGTYLADFHGSMPYLDIDYTFYVPAAKRVSPWKNVISVFQPDMWIAIVFTVFTVNFLILTISQFVHTNENYKNCVYLSMHVLGIFLLESQRIPKSSIIRYLLVIWSIFGFMMTSCYESALVSFMTRPAYEPQLDSLEGVVDSDLVVAGQPSMRQQFIEGRNYYTREIYERWVDCPLGIVCVNLTAEKRSVAAFANTRNVRFYRKDLMDSYGRSKIFQLPILTRTNLWMMMRKGFPLTGEFTRIILYLRQSGIMTKWISDITYRDKGQVVVLNNKISITLDHFHLPFCLYFVGILTAFIVFLFEILMPTKNTNHKSTKSTKKSEQKRLVYVN